MSTPRHHPSYFRASLDPDVCRLCNKHVSAHEGSVYLCPDLPPEAFGVELDPLPPWAREKQALAEADRALAKIESEEMDPLSVRLARLDHESARAPEAAAVTPPALPPDAAALIREARALSIDPYTTEICDALEGALKENARLTRRLALIEQHDTTRVLESQLEMLREERAKDRDAHARERDQILGDVAHARAETAQAKAEIERLKARAEKAEEELSEALAFADQQRSLVRGLDKKIAQMKPVVEAAERWRDGADRGELARAIDAHRGHGPLDRSDLRGLAAREAAR